MRDIGWDKVVDFSDPTTAPKALREALSRFVTGVTVITTQTASGLHGLTANSFSALSLDPPLILWSLRNNASTFRQFTQEAAWFAVNVLSAEQQDLSHRFAVTSTEKFADLAWYPGLAGCPLIPRCIARFECSVDQRVPGGDHVIFIGRVERATFTEGEPLLFHAGSYCVATPIARVPPFSAEASEFMGLSLETSHFF
jgi:flavin reductase (DIM6/NTAB) family NADH-FMN oxidoreductase RutF